MSAIRLNKNDFNAGSPYSEWLKEEIAEELYGTGSRGLVQKYNIRVFDGILDYVFDQVRCLDDYPEKFYEMAAEIIRIELDPEFKG